MWCWRRTNAFENHHAMRCDGRRIVADTASGNRLRIEISAASPRPGKAPIL